MLHFSRWKTLAILSSVVLALIFALPSMVPAGPRAILESYGLRAITLGLDLQGGSNVLLEVDRNDLRDKLAIQVTGDIRSALREAKIGYSGINRTPSGVSVRINKIEDMDRAETELKKLLQPVDTGIFSAGATTNLLELSRQEQQFTLGFSETGIDAKVTGAIAQTLKIIESRVNALGTAEPVIQQQGKDRIVVQLPGVQDPERVKNVIGRT
ncbi:MAG: protein translocase subunit SecDF, partial [Alphaproteobacteria bacterium]|nr:protein translocase subunit SecDF [Alphaproteobacteria bacterium]